MQNKFVVAEYPGLLECVQNIFGADIVRSAFIIDDAYTEIPIEYAVEQILIDSKRVFAIKGPLVDVDEIMLGCTNILIIFSNGNHVVIRMSFVGNCKIGKIESDTILNLPEA